MSSIDEAKRRMTEDRSWRSENASSTARRLSLSVVAVVWGLMTMSAAQNGIPISQWQHVVLLLAGMAAVASLFADWLQAIAGYVTADRAWERVNAPDYHPEDKPYVKDLPYWLTVIGFWVKQSLAPLSFFLLLSAVAPIVMSGL